MMLYLFSFFFFFFQAEDGIRDVAVTGVQTCALPISRTRDDRPVPFRDPLSRPAGAGDGAAARARGGGAPRRGGRPRRGRGGLPARPRRAPRRAVPPPSRERGGAPAPPGAPPAERAPRAARAPSGGV